MTSVRSVALAKLVSFTPLNLATWQKSIFIDCLRPSCKYIKYDFFFILLHTSVALYLKFSKHILI